MGLLSLGFGLRVEPFVPRIRRSPCDTDAPRNSRAARAPWNKWKGPAPGPQRSAAPSGKAPVYAAKGPCSPARGATVRTSGG
jgi:hypothetical protein